MCWKALLLINEVEKPFSSHALLGLVRMLVKS